MRAFAFALAASLAAFSASGAAAPKRVVSLNLCTDELLLMIADPRQIVSVTHLAQKPRETRLWKRARAYRKNDGTLVSITNLKPDLVLLMEGGARDRVRIASRLGIRTLDLPFPQSLADIRKSIVDVAAALGRPTVGRRWLRAIDELERTAPRRGVDTIWLGGGGRTVAAEGLAADWMRLAGFRQRRLMGDRVSLEQLLISPPKLLLRSDYRSDQYSSEQRWLAHPLASQARAARTVHTDGRAWTCMGPVMISEVARLRRAVRK